MNLKVQLQRIIRPARPSDKPRLVELINAAYRVEDFFKYDDRVNLQELDEYYEQGQFFVSEADGKVEACIYLELKSDRAYFGLLSVDPAFQGKGIGKALMEYVEKHAAAAGCRFMDIHIVNIRPELPVFYGKHGYTSGAISPFPKPSKIPCHFVQMSKPLTLDKG